MGVTVPHPDYVAKILDDLKREHQVIRSFDIIREEEQNSEKIVLVEIRTEEVSLVYSYRIDKQNGEIKSRELMYVMPLL